MTYSTVPPSYPEENLQSVIRRWMNREIREYFNDFGVDENWSPDLTTPRGVLASVLQHSDDDTYQITQLKCWFFEHIKSQAYRVPYYGIPVASYQETRKFKPQIKLFFQEDFADVDPDFPPVTGEVSFRLANHTHETITPAIAQQFATRIDTSFATGAGRVWRKGKDMASYTDKARGYQLQLLSRSEADARILIESILDIQQDTPDWSKMNYSSNQEEMTAYPTLPPVDFIYGDSRRLPRKRPIADVRFMSAFLHVWGMPNPIVLVDRTGAHSTALVAA